MIQYKDEWRGTFLEETKVSCESRLPMWCKQFIPSCCKGKFMEFKAAPLPSDIYWDNAAVGWCNFICRSFVAAVGLVVVMFLLVTPISIADIVVPIFLNIQSDFKLLLEEQTSHLPPGEVANMIRKINGSYDHLFTAFFTQYFPTLALIFVNSVILPIAIEWIATFQALWRKEAKEQSTLFMNYGFMVLNLLIIPLLGLDSLNAFITYSVEIVRKSVGKPVVKQVTELVEMLGIVLLSSSATFAMKYFITSIFISSASQLLQAPQALLSWWNTTFVAVTTKEKDLASMRWPFDWGYWYGYNCAFFAVAITFAPSVPLICPLASLHFFTKYYVDRYTLVYGVFEPLFQADGNVEQMVIRCLYTSVIFMQFVMSGFIAIQASTDANFMWVAYLHIVMVVVIVFLAVTKTEIKRDFSKVQDYDYLRVYNQARTPSVDIEELQFRVNMSNEYKHPCVKTKAVTLKDAHWWQWPADDPSVGKPSLGRIGEESSPPTEEAESDRDCNFARDTELDARFTLVEGGPRPPNPSPKVPRDTGPAEMEPLLQPHEK